MITRRGVLASAGAAGAMAVLGGGIRPTKAADKKTVVLASMGPVTGNWDPTSHTTLGQGNFEKFVFNALTRAPMSDGEPDKLEPALALSWQLIDRNTFEFKLRDGVKFHDGKKFGAEDVKATLEYSSDPKRPAASLCPGKVDVEIVDHLTVRLRTEKYGYPASTWRFISSVIPILSAKDVADPKILEKRPNGTNAFKYVATNGDQNVLHANDDYFGGRPKLDEVIYAYVPDANTRVLGLLNGQYQIAERLEPEQYASLQGNPKVFTRKGLTTENKYLHFRCNKPPFDDPRIRLAACHSIDRSQILELMGEAALPSSCYVSPMKFGYKDIAGYPEYNPDEAQRLLTEAGFPGGKGLPPLEYITSIGFYPKTKEYGELITAMLQEQGFNVQLTVLEPAAWEVAIYRRADGQGQGHMCDVGWMTPSPEPDLVLRPNWQSKAALISGVNDPEIDAVLDKERNAATPEERLKILTEETFPTMAKKVPSFSLFSALTFHGAAKNLEGAVYLPYGPIDLSKADLV
ncbi:ABC transporter substrate-binding protein [Mesorhizobium sp.]|uniref:ABC transporter substrate-binding protein n=2 Tax=Mesorhizobium sp. TaxID=1871066 RepID=UPI000FE7317C|nr:ABC transporter substrate-binding protein [Mesorhizobium sp.]RWG07749.1 MAG: ABC transporter substrate-binding protein [Mesorhizobium sp.]RWH02962.1 MAG: ABC transporter substrate-binding protein [Mesorhizobium sp.]RWI16457.1 MAG: ABC transporter substrate-binding protein [Mesorhizobium sp.]RWN08485.1 MAG: ABC transporter substrate-binding protein [Mesorhizobium sp.]RWN08697.1 MAG: ABC transporter substrate-binding protein [Mesorhizobium sp.]